MKNTYVLGFLGLTFIAGVIACGNSSNNSNRSTTPIPPPPGQRAGQSQSVSKNGAKIDSAGDDIELKNSGTYNPTDYTHVINPAVKPNLTGYSSNEAYQFVDGANDKLMETLRARVDSRRRIGDSIEEKSIGTASIDQLKAGDLELARSISMAELRRLDKGNFEFHIWTTQSNDEIVLETSYMEDLEGTVKSKKMPLEAQSNADEYKQSTAQCVTRDTDKEKSCQTIVLSLTKGANIAYIVFRRTPAKVFLGEYSSRLLSKYQNDNIIDRWVEFFQDVVTYQVRQKGSFNDTISAAELKSFAVVNGVAAFTLSIDRRGSKFIVSGDMVSSLKNSSEKLNIPLQRGVISGMEEQPTDYISESVTDVTMLHANGRGMMEIAVQLMGGANSSNLGADDGGVVYNKTGLANSGKNSAELFMRNMEIRFNIATRTKSMRLQEKSNRAIRFTVVPVISNVADPVL